MTHPARYPKWGGRRVQRLAAAVIAAKGSTCHLCLEPGADSPDHNPPRSALIREGIPDPDAMRYLWPAHRLCNIRRKDRPLSPALTYELQRARANTPEARRSPRFGGVA